jgi:putative oxidoreductase
MSAFPIPTRVRRAVAAAYPARRFQRAASYLPRANARLRRTEAACHRLLVVHSIAMLRVSLGVVFLLFGILKFFPGVSPAQNLVEQTTHLLTLGLLPSAVAVVLVATMECTIGLCLISGRFLRPAIYLLGAQMIGILSPLILLTGRLFDGPHGAPTLEGQYVLKDIILVGATLVMAATTLGGARLAPPSDPPVAH